MPTSLPLPLASAEDLFKKLKRDADLLDEEVTTDRFFNFVITGHSLIDWVKADPDLSAIDVKALQGNQWLKICRDLANASKHFHLNYKPITSSAKSVQGFGLGRYGAGSYGTGEESIEVKLDDGTAIEFLDFVGEVVGVWQAVFPKA